MSSTQINLADADVLKNTSKLTPNKWMMGETSTQQLISSYFAMLPLIYFSPSSS
jgi:hypothetical protein